MSCLHTHFTTSGDGREGYTLQSCASFSSVYRVRDAYLPIPKCYGLFKGVISLSFTRGMMTSKELIQCKAWLYKHQILDGKTIVLSRSGLFVDHPVSLRFLHPRDKPSY